MKHQTDPDKLTSSSYHFQVVAALTARVLDQVFGMISLEFKDMIKKTAQNYHNDDIQVTFRDQFFSAALRR